MIIRRGYNGSNNNTPKRISALAVFFFIMAGLFFIPDPAVSQPMVVKGHPAALDAVIANMSLEQKAGQLIITSPGMAVNTEFEKNLKQGFFGGIVLYRNMLQDAGQTVRLTDRLQRCSAVPLFIAIDQEGGRVNRIPFGTAMPGNMALGAAHTPDFAYQAGKLTGSELVLLGINTDFAPCLDIYDLRPSGTTIRSFGADPKLTAELGRSYITGLQDAGVLACAKHFPGIGGAAADSHVRLPEIHKALPELEKCDLVPFQAAIDQKVDMIMPAHVAYPRLDDTKAVSRSKREMVYLPATLSPEILSVARNQMEFSGLIVTDVLGMDAISKHFGSEDETAVKAVQAGADLVIVYSRPELVHQRLVQAVKTGEIPEKRLNDSVKRILAAKLKCGVLRIEGRRLVLGDRLRQPVAKRIQAAVKGVGSADHAALERKIADQAVTLVRNEDRTLPFKVKNGDRILLLADTKDIGDRLTKEIRKTLAGQGKGRAIVTMRTFRSFETLSKPEQDSLYAADWVIFASCAYGPDADQLEALRRHFMAQVIQYCNTIHKPLAVMVIGDPFEAGIAEEAPACLLLYSDVDGPALRSGIEAIFGKLKPTGRLPVEVLSTKGRVLYQQGLGLRYE
ncbi:MAG: glycoside hydrolase family 3 protein [Solirubrobacterales bacterium]